MACFTGLPNEIYFEILGYLPPPDLGSFFCVNKHLYDLTAIQRTTYHSLKRRFSTSLDTKQPGSMAKLIKSILVDPQIALYVQHFTINDCSDLRDGEDPGDEREPAWFTNSEIAQIKNALRDLDLLYLYDYFLFMEVEETMEDVHSAPEYNLIALALMLFPNLTSIDVRGFHDFERFYNLRCILADMIWQTLDTESSGVLFPKLTSVTVSAPGEAAIALIESFATLPSVKIINADKFVASTESLETIAPAKGSKVSDLNISNADFPSYRLTVYLQRFEWLQSFTYWPTNSLEPWYDFDAFMIITALLASTKNSLRELHIRSGSGSEIATQEYMGILRNFRVLEHLEINTDLLQGPHLSRDEAFLMFLPSSIKEVRLHGCRSLPDNDSFLNINLRSAMNDLPSLRSIGFFGTRFSENQATYLQNMYGRNNICLKLVDSDPVALPIYTRHRGHYAERQAKKTSTQ